MKYSIDTKSKESAYLQLYRQLRSDIVEGRYHFGYKLPSKRLLSEECGASVITVEHAYAILCDEGYAESRQRSGYYVIYRENGRERAPRQRGGEELCCTVQKPDPETFPFTVYSKTVRRVLSDYGERILVKSPNRGCPELRQAICDYLARSNGMEVASESIIIGSGAEYLYTLTAQLLGRDRKFALEDPSYEKIYGVYSACGVECDMLKLGSDGIFSSELERTDATVLHITPFNSYPSSVTADASKRREYIRWAKERDGYIVEDNFDSELTVSRKAEDTVFSLDPGGRVIYLNTFSHTVAPSVRVGYMILPEKLMEKFAHTLDFYSCTVPVFEQYILAELIKSGDFERHINRVRRKRRKNEVV